jgi:hypothetical protein
MGRKVLNEKIVFNTGCVYFYVALLFYEYEGF